MHLDPAQEIAGQEHCQDQEDQTGGDDDGDDAVAGFVEGGKGILDPGLDEDAPLAVLDPVGGGDGHRIL